VCELEILITKGVAFFYLLRANIQFLAKIRNTPETLWRQTGCRTPYYVNAPDWTRIHDTDKRQFVIEFSTLLINERIKQDGRCVTACSAEKKFEGREGTSSFVLTTTPYAVAKNC
jgi:hypothetical protein